MKLISFAGNTTLFVRLILCDHCNIHKLECMNPISPDVDCGIQRVIFGGQKWFWVRRNVLFMLLGVAAKQTAHCAHLNSFQLDSTWNLILIKSYSFETLECHARSWRTTILSNESCNVAYNLSEISVLTAGFLSERLWSQTRQQTAWIIWKLAAVLA